MTRLLKGARPTEVAEKVSLRSVTRDEALKLLAANLPATGRFTLRVVEGVAIKSPGTRVEVRLPNSVRLRT
jgi:hypothetical protein